MLRTAPCLRRQFLHAVFAKPGVRPYSDSPDASPPVSSKSSSLPIIEIPKSSVYAPGDPNTAEPALRDVSWTVHPHEAWAVVSAGHGASKRALFSSLIGSHRLHPNPLRGIFPFLGHRPPEQHVWFAGSTRGQKGGEFFDYTARYGAMREGDGITLRESYFPDLVGHSSVNGVRHRDPHRRRKIERLQRLVDELHLGPLLDLPLIALSNGQTRRARLARGLLARPALLILDEPLSACASLCGCRTVLTSYCSWSGRGNTSYHI